MRCSDEAFEGNIITVQDLQPYTFYADTEAVNRGTVKLDCGKSLIELENVPEEMKDLTTFFPVAFCRATMTLFILTKTGNGGYEFSTALVENGKYIPEADQFSPFSYELFKEVLSFILTDDVVLIEHFD